MSVPSIPNNRVEETRVAIEQKYNRIMGKYDLHMIGVDWATEEQTQQ